MVILQRLAKALKRVGSLPELPATCDNEALAWRSYCAAQAAWEAFGSTGDMIGQRVLDLGCGLGGKTVYYAEQEVQFVVGLDVSKVRARVAREFANLHPVRAKTHIIVGDAARLPFRTDVFNRVVSTDTWEHLRAPTRAVRECARVVRPSGTVLISTMPYYSPWGAHAWHWLPLPWIQVVLPRDYLFRLMSWIERRRQVNVRRPSAVRLDWTRSDDPAHARRLTVAALERNLPLDRMRLLRFVIVPVGARYGSVAAQVMGALIRLPLLRELLAGMVVVVMRRPPSAG